MYNIIMENQENNQQLNQVPPFPPVPPIPPMPPVPPLPPAPIVPGEFRVMDPTCPFIAQIATKIVDDISVVKQLANCLVHVSNINTTIYVDAQHRYLMVYAGPVFVDNYNYVSNPLNLRSQTCYDFQNNRAIIYNKVGGYKLITLQGA